MIAVFGGVLLCSFLLHQVFSPIGDAVLRHVDGQTVALDGTVADSGIQLLSADGSYKLSNPSAVAGHAGRRVHITGTLHESAALLDIATIRDTPTR